MSNAPPRCHHILQRLRPATHLWAVVAMDAEAGEEVR